MSNENDRVYIYSTKVNTELRNQIDQPIQHNSPKEIFSFGSSTNPTTTSATPFTFGAGSTTTAPSGGTSASPFTFGAATTTNLPTSAPFGGSTGAFGFGATPVFSFGETATTTATVTQPSAFTLGSTPVTSVVAFPTTTIATSALPSSTSFLPVTSIITTTTAAAAAAPSSGTSALSSLLSQPITSTPFSIPTTTSSAPTISFPSSTTTTTATTIIAPIGSQHRQQQSTIPTTATAVTTTSAPTGVDLGGLSAPPVSSVASTASAPMTSTTSVYSTSTLGTTSIIQKPKESSDPLDQLLPGPLNDLVDNFITMLSETGQLLTDMEHTSTSKFINVHEQIVRVQQHVLDIQSDVQRDESTFAQINQTYQQKLYNATICKYLRSLPLGADIDDRVVDNYLMQKVDDIKVNYKQCQDVLDCAEERLQTNGLGVSTEDLVATAKNVYTGIIAASSKANQTHKIVEDLKYRILGHQNNSNDV